MTRESKRVCVYYYYNITKQLVTICSEEEKDVQSGIQFVTTLMENIKTEDDIQVVTTLIKEEEEGTHHHRQ